MGEPVRLPGTPDQTVGRPLIMGVVNVTPDSFSDGGRWSDADSAIDHAELLLTQGADILDVGGESTRPGAGRPSETEELGRVLPVVREMASRGACVSVDTMRASVAQACLEAGAAIINDVSGGLADPNMARLVADTGATFVAMHWRGHSHDMQTRTQYDDVVVDVARELSGRIDALLSQGVRREKLVLDPGLGFAKTAAQNWELIANIDAFERFGLPLLVGASRKSFLGRVGVPADLPAVPADQRDAATAAISALMAQQRVWAVRVHDVPSTLAAIDVVAHVRRAATGNDGEAGADE